MSYTLKEQLANPGNYGGSRVASQIKYLIFHYTGNDGDKAANNAAYFQNNVVEASAHYFVDDTTVWRSVPDLKVAWAVGGSKYPNADKTGGGTMHGSSPTPTPSASRCAIPSGTVSTRPARPPWPTRRPWAGS